MSEQPKTKKPARPVCSLIGIFLLLVAAGWGLFILGQTQSSSSWGFMEAAAALLIWTVGSFVSFVFGFFALCRDERPKELTIALLVIASPGILLVFLVLG